MAEKSGYILELLQSRPIVDYLEQKGIIPARRQGGKSIYLCPLHEGDTDPSFFVYTGGEYDKFRCYGCNRFGDVINLHSAMEKISIKEAFASLAKGLDLKGDHYLDRRAKDMKVREKFQEISLPELNLMLSRHLFRYVSSSAFDVDELEWMEKVMKEVDKIVIANDDKNLDIVYNFIVDQGMPKKNAALAKSKRSRDRG